MTKISIDLDKTLNRRLKQFALDKYGSTHGRQQMIIRDALIAYLDAQESKLAEPEECVATVLEEGPVPAAARTVTRPRKTKKVTMKFKEDIDATNKVRGLWAGGERNVSKIARLFAPKYTLRQVNYWIDREIKSGRLSKDVATPSTS